MADDVNQLIANPVGAKLYSPPSRDEVLKLPAGARYVSPVTSRVAVRGSPNEAAASGFKPEDLGTPSVSRATPQASVAPAVPAVAPTAPAVAPAAPASAADFYGTPAATTPVPPPGGVPPAYEPGGSMPAPPDTATIARHALGYRSYHGMPSAPGDADQLNALSLQAAQAGRNYMPPGATGGVSALTLPPTVNSPQAMLGHIADLRARGLITQDQAAAFANGAPPGMFGQPQNPLTTPGGASGATAATPAGGNMPLGQMIPAGSA